MTIIQALLIGIAIMAVIGIILYTAVRVAQLWFLRTKKNYEGKSLFVYSYKDGWTRKKRKGKASIALL